MRRMLVTLAVVLAVPPASAAATTVSTTTGGGSRNIVITGDAKDNRIAFYVLDTPTGEATMIISDLAATVQQPIVVAPGSLACSADASGGASCRVDAAGLDPVGAIRVLGGDGDDAVNAETGHDWEFEMELDGGAGDDVLALGASHGTATGGEGDDALTGDLFDGNRYDAGPGDDTVVGGWGDDTIDLGTGRDRAVAGAGDDAIAAQDGEADDVDCGTGADSVRGDQRDALRDCDTLAVVVMPDGDGDGVAPPEDCNDADPAVKPRARTRRRPTARTTTARAVTPRRRPASARRSATASRSTPASRGSRRSP